MIVRAPAFLQRHVAADDIDDVMLAAATCSMVSCGIMADGADEKIIIALGGPFRNLVVRLFLSLPMRLLDRYIGRELLTSAHFCRGYAELRARARDKFLRKLFELVVDHNLPTTYIFTFVAYFMPFSLTFSIPWGFLTAVLLGLWAAVGGQ